MYTDYFGFDRAPFGADRDLHFFYNSSSYAKAAAYLLYGIQERKSLHLLSAEKGAGKTLFLRRFAATHKKNFACALFSISTLSVKKKSFFEYGVRQVKVKRLEDLLDAICKALNLQIRQYPYEQKLKIFQDFVEAKEAENSAVVLLIDNAHDLTRPMLSEFLRFCDNLSKQAKPYQAMQVVLTGSPELEQMLRHPSFDQEPLRTALRSRLEPIKSKEVERFINHRLLRAGYRGGGLFSPAALELIAAYSAGVPGSIVRLCDDALARACVTSHSQVSAGIIEDVFEPYTPTASAREANGRPDAEPAPDPRPVALAPSAEPRQVSSEPTSPAPTTPGPRRVPLSLAASLAFAAGIIATTVIQWQSGSFGDWFASDRKPNESTSEAADQRSGVALAAAPAIESRPGPSTKPPSASAIPFRVSNAPDVSVKTKLDIVAKAPQGDSIRMAAIAPWDGVDLTKPGLYREPSAEQRLRTAQAALQAELQSMTLARAEAVRESKDLRSRLTRASAQLAQLQSQRIKLSARYEKALKAIGLLARERDHLLSERTTLEAELTEIKRTVTETALVSSAEPARQQNLAPLRAREAQADTLEAKRAHDAQLQVQELLTRADQQFAARHLTTPENDNALDTYGELLSLFPAHPEALRGIERIRQQYLEWAQAAELKTDWRKARIYYRHALRIDPADSTVTAALEQVSAQTRAREQ